MVIINYKFHYTQREREYVTVLTYIQSHLLMGRQYLWRESEVVCVRACGDARGGDYYFHSFQFITHSFRGTSNSLEERVTEQETEMREAQECGR